jgi:predicted metalloprotease with PDZ domain
MGHILAALVWGASVGWAGEAVRYELRFPNAAHHEAEVRVTFTDLPPGPLEIVMSRASPGRYAVHEFPRNLYNERAHDGQGRQLKLERVAPAQWNVSGHSGTVVFEYTLYGDVVDGTYNAIDLTHAHLNAPATFVWARGLEQRPVRVRLEPPEQLEWRVATQMADLGDGWFGTDSRDLLMDSPIEFSAHKVREWRAGDSVFRMVLHALVGDQVASEFARLCEAITLEAEGIFGAFPNYDAGHYTFLLDYLPWASGDAMEHRNSTVISSAMELLRRSYGDFVESVAHEFFHSWNVERIRPRSLEPFDFERANMSGELWFAEGFTNYYAPLILARAGITTPEQFAADLGRALNAVWTSPGRQWLNAPGMSRLAPFFDRAGGAEPTNQVNMFLSYYYYGQALAAGLDLEIRGRFPGKSLDDWMRALWRAHPDVHRPYTPADLEHTLAEVTSREFAREMFERYVDGPELMDYAALLERAGFVVRKSAAPGEVWFGAPRISFPGRGVQVNGAVLRGSPAYLASIDRGDRIVAIDGKEIKDQREWERILKSYKPGDHSRIQVEGRSGRRNVGLVWQEPPDIEVVPAERLKQALTPEQRSFRAEWLGSHALRPLPPLPKVE